MRLARACGNPLTRRPTGLLTRPSQCQRSVDKHPRSSPHGHHGVAGPSCQRLSSAPVPPYQRTRTRGYGRPLSTGSNNSMVATLASEHTPVNLDSPWPSVHIPEQIPERRVPDPRVGDIRPQPQVEDGHTHVLPCHVQHRLPARPPPCGVELRIRYCNVGESGSCSLEHPGEHRAGPPHVVV